MSKKHSPLYDDVLGGLDSVPTAPPVGRSSRFLKRSTTIADQISGEIEEKTLRWVDPAECRMWERHNRDYSLLTEENCRDLIDGIRAQGRQEFAAIVRPIDDPEYRYEVICGARRHFAVSWLRANTYTQFKFLVDAREFSDEEAFRLADIENRDREDISDYERAIDYADAIERYYGGKQKAMADRLEVSPPWLSRYLQLAKLPTDIVSAFATIRDIKERHARELKPLMADPEINKRLMDGARLLGAEQALALAGQGQLLEGAEVMKRLKLACKPPTLVGDDVDGTAAGADRFFSVRQRGRKTIIEFDRSISTEELSAALDQFLNSR